MLPDTLTAVVENTDIRETAIACSNSKEVTDSLLQRRIMCQLLLPFWESSCSGAMAEGVDTHQAYALISIYRTLWSGRHCLGLCSGTQVRGGLYKPAIAWNNTHNDQWWRVHNVGSSTYRDQGIRRGVSFRAFGILRQFGPSLRGTAAPTSSKLTWIVPLTGKLSSTRCFRLGVHC